jgi:hypothetical protein
MASTAQWGKESVAYPPKRRIEIERWLAARSSQVAAVISARAALRAVPTLIEEGEFSKDVESYLPVFRALSSAWVFASYQVKDPSFYAAIESIVSAPFPRSALSRAASSAARVVHGAGLAQHPHAAKDACRYAIEAISRLLKKPPNIIEADVFSADIRLLSSMSPRRLGSTWKLWPGGTPAWAEDSWSSVSRRMIDDHPDWAVWTKWYRNRLSGSWSTKALEIDRIIISEEFWRESARAVNSEISRLIKKHREEDVIAVDDESPSTALEEAPSVPQRRPAAVSPIWQNGILVAPQQPATTDIDTADFVAALSALRIELKSLADDISDEANIDK